MTIERRNMYENIAEIAFQWGQMFEKKEVDFPNCSSDMHDQVIELAEEFEENWKNVGVDGDYITMIDNFIYKKLKNPIDIKQLLKNSEKNINYGIEEDLLNYFIFGKGMSVFNNQGWHSGQLSQEVFYFVDTIDHDKYINDVMKLHELNNYLEDASEVICMGSIGILAERMVVNYCWVLINEIMKMLNIEI